MSSSPSVAWEKPAQPVWLARSVGRVTLVPVNVNVFTVRLGKEYGAFVGGTTPGPYRQLPLSARVNGMV